MDYVRENVVAKAEFQADRNVHIDLSPFLNLYHFQPVFFFRDFKHLLYWENMTLNFLLPFFKFYAATVYK